MPVFFLKKAGFSRTAALVSVNFGAIDSAGIDDSDSPPGVAHFLEHVLFKKSEGDLSNHFALLGSSVNAGTDYVSTTFYVTSSAEISKSLLLLGQLAFTPFFEPDIVEKERHIITQEVLMYEDDPARRVYTALLQCLYHRHPVRYEIAGTVESVARTTPDILRRCHKRYYVPANAVACVCGDFDTGAVREALERSIASSLEGNEGSENKRAFCEPETLSATQSSISMAAGRARVLLGYKDTPTMNTGRELMLREIVTSLMLDYVFGKCSRDAVRLYDEKLIDDSFSFAYICHETFGFTALGGECDEPLKVAESLEALARKTLKSGINKRRLEALKRKYLGRYIGTFDSPEACVFAMAAAHFRRVEIFEFPGILRRVSSNQIAERLESHLVTKKPAVSILWPVTK